MARFNPALKHAMASQTVTRSWRKSNVSPTTDTADWVCAAFGSCMTSAHMAPFGPVCLETLPLIGTPVDSARSCLRHAEDA
jgi:hypothetical protein